ncbi:NADH:flavin oxidoreductase/NADH oxidase family protein [Streptomyces sp. NPDC051776]|uniref:NADH:flavin oxidoreductase/NADH oxidase family protein n=1 Tax=Streptomyces sp. NPDC051776 TaxID=3155414 RepID=UPI0034258532
MMSIDLTTALTLPSGARLPNRIAKVALSEGLSDRTQAPTYKLIRLYRRWADSGAGLLITGNVMIDRRALSELGNVAVEDDRHIELLAEWAAAATAGGGQAWVQLCHPGRQAPRALNGGSVAPSEITAGSTLGVYGKPRALTTAEIDDVIHRFATAARTVVAAGFTGVQIHAAHGYLLSQFLSPLTNLRTDAWGGTPVKRRRLLLEIVRAVRAELGPHTPVSVKLNSADFQRGGMDEDESTEVVLALALEGIDLLEISGGTFESVAFMGAPDGAIRASTRAREAYFLDYAERVRTTITHAGADLPLMVTGGFRSTSVMTEAITSGAIDVVGLGRPLIMEPDLPQRLLAGGSGARPIRPRKLGIKQFEGMGELLWYGVQLRRLGNGKNPDPNRHPVRNLPLYLIRAGMLGRPQRRGFAI